MNRIRSWVRAFFGFSRNETNAFLILLPALFVIVFLIPSYQAYFARQKKDYLREHHVLDSLIATWKQQEQKDSLTTIPIHHFAFNPNTATKEELIRLGFTPFMAGRLENYRNKGGKFIIKSDVLKLYGMDTVLYSNLYSWIQLPVERPIKQFEEKKKTETAHNPVKEKFDLNLADTSQLISIYGIGSKLSLRIIKYRDRLGGFITYAQLNEVYGLDSVVINQLKKKTFVADHFKPKTLELNSVTEKELAMHPYIKYPVAKAITAYRFQHGSFKSIDELSEIAIIDPPTLEKIKPYLSINP